MSSSFPTCHSLLPFCLVLLLVGCAAEKFSTGRGDPAIATTPLNTPSPTQSKLKTRTLKLRLSLDSPADLLVKEGESVSKGQVICDRPSVRIALEGQRQGLLLKLHVLELRGKQPVRVEPEPSYALELAKVEEARAEVRGLEAQILGFEDETGFTQVAWQQLPMQKLRRELGVLRQKLGKARMGVRVAVAQLEQARDDYRRRVAMAKAKVGDEPLERVQILQELKTVEGQILRTGRVMAPRAGVVKKIKWLGMQDQTLQAEVSLAGVVEKPEQVTS